VRVEQGLVSGARSDRIVVYKGMPYAAPPVGGLRWRPPQPGAHWSGIRPATAFGAACLQPTGAANIAGDPGPVSEDCLTLNIWTPRQARRAPIMVWIHGGGHRFGSSSQPYYDGATFARDGVVFISLNYRLAGLGFFAHPALTKEAGPKAPLGNYGLMDQIAALQWVRANAAAFGGDPGNVTIMGESSSALDVQALMAIPAAEVLFRKAIVESSCDWDGPVTLAQREADGVKLAAEAGAPGAAVDPSALRAMPGTAFLDPGFNVEFAPFPDGRLLKQSVAEAFAEGRTPRIAMILGSNSDEGAIAQNLEALKPLAHDLAALYPHQGQSEAALRQLDTDRFFGAACRWIAGQNAQRAPTFLYRFSYLPKALKSVLPGAPHGSELPYVFDSLASFPSASPPAADDQVVADRLHSCWVSFAKTGQPSCAGAPVWPAYSRRTDRLVDFDDATTVRSRVRAPQYDALDRLVLPALLDR
jgi:para-nitrobenzyl esterase